MGSHDRLGILKNPAYKGMAGYGKTRSGPMRPRLRPQRGDPPQPRWAHSTYNVPPEEWASIPVPSLVEPALFDAVQEQLEENRRRQREGGRGARHLLQGLLVCETCGHAYYGKRLSLKCRQRQETIVCLLSLYWQRCVSVRRTTPLL